MTNKQNNKQKNLLSNITDEKILCVHFKITRKDLMKVSYKYFLEVMLDGYVSLVTANIHKSIISLTRNDTCKVLFALAKFNKLDMIEYILRTKGKKIYYEKAIMNGAASGGSLDILRYGFSKKFSHDFDICMHAMLENQTDAILLAIENGCKLSVSVRDIANAMKNVFMVQWFEKNSHLFFSNLIDLRYY
jgi:hypothetical protein